MKRLKREEHYLFPDLVFSILSFCDLKTLIPCYYVSKTWYAIIKKHEERYFRTLYSNYWSKVTQKKPPESLSRNKWKKLLGNVNIVISQIANPERTEIRNKAIKLGARYSPNFNQNVTHLICPVDARQSVDKILQALSSPKKVDIVCRKWLDECEKTNKICETNEYRVFGKENMGHKFTEDELNLIEKEGFAGLENWKNLFVKKYSSKLDVFQVSDFFNGLSHHAGSDDIDIFEDDDFRPATEEELNSIAYVGKKVTLRPIFGQVHINISKDNIYGFMTVSELMETVIELEEKEGRNGDVSDHIFFEGTIGHQSFGTFSVCYGS